MKKKDINNIRGTMSNAESLTKQTGYFNTLMKQVKHKTKDSGTKKKEAIKLDTSKIAKLAQDKIKKPAENKDNETSQYKRLDIRV